jgi:hypothetical protein
VSLINASVELVLSDAAFGGWAVPRIQREIADYSRHYRENTGEKVRRTI